MAGKRPLSNWAKTMTMLCLLLVLMINPMTRQMIFLLLPLGSGVDDLIFIILLFVTVTVFLIRGAQLNKVKKWLIEWFSK